MTENLSRTKANVWDANENTKREVFEFSEGYKKFLDKGKTERESVEAIITLAEREGFKNLDHFVENHIKIKPGDKVYAQFKGKQAILFKMGSTDPEKGFLVVGSHIDAPRLDLKQSPLYEDGKLAFFKTHYYGGIKKYQWITMPLALHGVVVKEDGTKINVSVGEEDGDPVFFITDLLPHLSKEQNEKKISEAIEGEMLNVLMGSMPHEDKGKKERFKDAILSLLNEKYNIVEEDFISSEFEIVPAGKARDAGLDRSMIGAYGQDDRVCAYASLMAAFHAENSGKSIMAVFADKEEIGSVGDTSMSSKFFENFIYEVLQNSAEGNIELIFRRSLQRSKFLSADVNAAMDPNFPNTHDKYNGACLGEGVVITKYTGSRGKSSSNDAHPEFLAEIRGLFNKNKIIWQIGELGKIDLGGGGTIAFIPAVYGMDVLDCGIALLSMHSPWELASKGDVHMLYKAFKAFFESNL
ncbi:aminopeptidase [Alkalibacter mobilis]|uniref:aminopeptidase n=1 Tax=Alkalibacter mobilis TaxID=2787712 RepID=UPI00189E0B65|nr:aminopeptidase [Alkalibacter mobilis]MBF7097836.1 aminopeptidase [Alkalibacter mobilis]